MKPGPTGEHDRELVARCRRGDEAAWEALVRKYRHLVYSIPYGSGLGPEEAGDVFQAVFLALLRHMDNLHQEETLIPWLVTTARRESWKVGRKRARERTTLQEEPEAPGQGYEPSDFVEEAERQVAVRAALDRIDSRCRSLLNLLFYSDPPPEYREIAAIMKMPVPSIGPTRIRCLEKLRRELKRGGHF